MPNAAPPTDPSMPPADRRRAGTWLARHGLAGARATPLLATRLAARRQARRAHNVLLAVLLIGAACAQVYGRFTTGAPGGFPPPRRTPLVIMTVLVVGLVLAQSLLDWWVRRIDRRAAATLSRRVAHPVQLGWRALLGRPYAAFAVATFTGAVVLAAGTLTVRDAALRSAAVIVLIGLCGVAGGTVLQLRHLLARPVVADDEDSLTADVIMRVEDAREVTTPAVVWSLPAVLLYGDALGWWNAASIIFVLGSGVVLCLIRARSAPVVMVARHAMSVR